MEKLKIETLPVTSKSKRRSTEVAGSQVFRRVEGGLIFWFDRLDQVIPLPQLREAILYAVSLLSCRDGDADGNSARIIFQLSDGIAQPVDLGNRRKLFLCSFFFRPQIDMLQADQDIEYEKQVAKLASKLQEVMCFGIKNVTPIHFSWELSE